MSNYRRENGEIEVGDLLVTSSEKGVAMKCGIKEVPLGIDWAEANAIISHNEK